MRRRQGYTLIDTLLAVSLLGTFSLLAFRLVYANFGIVQATLAADSNTARFDRAVGDLRSDVNASIKLQMPQPGVLQIELAGNKRVEWKTDSGTLSRQSEDQLRTWNVGQPIALKLDGAVALLSISPTDEIAMAGDFETKWKVSETPLSDGPERRISRQDDHQSPALRAVAQRESDTELSCIAGGRR